MTILKYRTKIMEHCLTIKFISDFEYTVDAPTFSPKRPKAYKGVHKHVLKFSTLFKMTSKRLCRILI